MKYQQNLGILGIGNLLLSDEGFGVHCIHYLEANYTFPRSVQLLDGGTGGIMLTSFLEEHARVIVIDTISMAGEPGAIRHISTREMRGADVGSRLSPHQLGLLETLELCSLRGAAPAMLDFFTINPLNLSSGVELSPLLFSKLPEISAMVLNEIARLGHPPVLKKNSAALCMNSPWLKICSPNSLNSPISTKHVKSSG
ncbi:MAG: HyaD/HybD family hydrogenase maturation endopeptidase [Desulfobulbaceae bacterium]|nr:HyaD/HybD family hydrogenase maturation endopeptidase [Desulfobulbaceae bacterium]